MPLINVTHRAPLSPAELLAHAAPAAGAIPRVAPEQLRAAADSADLPPGTMPGQADGPPIHLTLDQVRTVGQNTYDDGAEVHVDWSQKGGRTRTHTAVITGYNEHAKKVEVRYRLDSEMEALRPTASRLLPSSFEEEPGTYWARTAVLMVFHLLLIGIFGLLFTELGYVVLAVVLLVVVVLPVVVLVVLVVLVLLLLLVLTPLRSYGASCIKFMSTLEPLFPYFFYGGLAVAFVLYMLDISFWKGT